MMPAVMRQSGPKYLRDGVMFTPRAMIAQCDVCGAEHAPYGQKDSQGVRRFFCRDHNPIEQARAGAQPEKRQGE